MNLPLNYIIDVIYRNCKRVKYNRNIYNFECPICREGKSKGRKRRGYFFVKEGYFFCQNCQISWTPQKWVMEVDGISFRELIKDASEYNDTFNSIIQRNEDVVIENTETLPRDSINLNDTYQLEYYKNNKVVNDSLNYIHKRRLDTAINKPKTFYTSLTDETHSNRLCIPFYDKDDNIVYYQTRTIYDDKVKYLSKKNSKKPLYGINNISPSLEYIFIFEGPIDSMFVKNGVAVCGLHPTDHQLEQLKEFVLFKKIWIIDNQLDNKDVLNRYRDIIKKGEIVFLWPKEFNGYKDINDICIKSKRDHVPPNLFIDNSFKGIKAEMKLIEIVGKI